MNVNEIGWHVFSVSYDKNWSEALIEWDVKSEDVFNIISTLKQPTEADKILSEGSPQLVDTCFHLMFSNPSIL